MKNLETKLKNLTLKSPLLTASGTSGSRDEVNNLLESKKELNALGAFVSKGVTLKPRLGNNPIRVVEVSSGLINAIGLQNKGVNDFIKNALPKLKKHHLPIFVNISAGSEAEFGELARTLSKNDTDGVITGLEINVSCPNIHEGGKVFATNPKLVERIVKSVRKKSKKGMFLITKLTPNVSDIKEPAKAAISGGTDALSMINTLRAVAINVDTKKPVLDNINGGLSGPAVKPVGVFMVYDCFKNIPECNNKSIPIIGMGGVNNWRDSVEYIMAGASAVAVGTGWFTNPKIFSDIKTGLAKYLKKENTSISKLIGVANS